MLLDNFPMILWINLARSTKRRQYMENLLSKYKLHNIRIEAIDGRDKNVMDSICIQHPNLSWGANACTCSHLIALKYFMEKISDDRIIIFEDDVSFDFLPLIPFNWDDLFNNLPKEYDVIQLAVSTDGQTLVKPCLIKTSYDNKYYSSNAYLITRQAAKNILDKYWNGWETSSKIDLSMQDYKYAAADAMISNTNATYSIPIFTYLATDSIIHPNHLHMHKRSKMAQYNMWKNTAHNLDIKTYFKQL